MSTKLTDAFKVSMQGVNKTVANEYATVTRVNSNKTVNVKPDSNDADSDDLINISYVVDLDLSVGDRVVLSYLNNDPNEPIIIGMLNPKSSPNVDCRSIVSVDKVETDGLVDVYKITYDKAPIYSYFSVKNGTIGSGVSEELAGKTVRLPVLIDPKTVTNVNSVEFDGLNGDEDGEYLIEGNIIYNGAVTDTYLLLKPNGVTINQRTSRHWNYTDGTNISALGNLILACNGVASGATVYFKAVLTAKTGLIRLLNGESITSSGASYVGEDIWAGVWSDITTNITSLVLELANTGTISGTIKLYKMVDVTYPTN